MLGIIVMGQVFFRFSIHCSVFFAFLGKATSVYTTASGYQKFIILKFDITLE
jgi:hypothetical protein